MAKSRPAHPETVPGDSYGGSEMPESAITPQDRAAIYDVLARYVWCMDTGDIEGVVATFTPDGAVQDRTGKRWDPPDGARRFATHFLTDPNRPLRQPWVQHLLL